MIIEWSPTSTLIVTFVITNVLIVMLNIASKYIKDGTKCIIARLLIGILTAIISAIALQIQWDMRVLSFGRLAFHCGQITILFMGFYYSYYKGLDSISDYTGLYFIRAVIAAPIIEELLFRGVFVPFLLESGWGKTFVFFYCSALFGCAHLHHLLTEDFITRQVIIQSLVQVGFTTLFGMYSSYVYYSTKSVITCIICHAYCNFLGFPDFSTLSHPTARVVYIVGIVLFVISFIIQYNTPLYDLL